MDSDNVRSTGIRLEVRVSFKYLGRWQSDVRGCVPDPAESNGFSDDRLSVITKSVILSKTE